MSNGRHRQRAAGYDHDEQIWDVVSRIDSVHQRRDAKRERDDDSMQQHYPILSRSKETAMSSAVRARKLLLTVTHPPRLAR